MEPFINTSSIGPKISKKERDIFVAGLSKKSSETLGIPVVSRVLDDLNGLSTLLSGLNQSLRKRVLRDTMGEFK